MKIGLDIRIAQLPRCSKRGFGHYIYNLTENVLKIDNKNDYFIFGYTKNDINLGKLTRKRLCAPLYPNFLSSKIEALFKQLQAYEIRKIEHEIKKNNIDIYISFSSGTPEFRINPHAKTKKIFLCYDLIPLLYKERYLKSKKELSRYKKFINTFQEANQIICISQNTKTDLLKSIDYNKDKVDIVYPGVDHHFFSNHLDKNILKEHNIPGNYFLYLGGLDPRKNVDKLIKALNYFPKETKKKTSLLIVGQKDEINYPRLQKMQQYTNIDNIIWTGYLPDFKIPTLLKHAAFLIFPSEYEGFGMPVLEAMASKCLTVTLNNSSIPEVTGRHTVILKNLSPSHIAKTMLKILENPHSYYSITEQAYKKSYDFTWKKSAIDFIRIINKLQ